MNYREVASKTSLFKAGIQKGRWVGNIYIPEKHTDKRMRIDTYLTEEDKRRVKKYADKYGLKMKMAYTVLIRKGLEYENSKND